MTPLLLSPDELVDLTGRRRRDAQERELEHMGIPYSTRRDGTLAVLRSVAEKVLGGDGTITALMEPQVQP